jgi:hypothetical protein
MSSVGKFFLVNSRGYFLFCFLMSCGEKVIQDSEEISGSALGGIRLERQDRETRDKREKKFSSHESRLHLLSSHESPFNISILSEIAPIQPRGQANSLTIEEGKAYVGYLTLGEIFAGGVDIFDVTKKDNPKLVDSYVAPGLDVNSVAVSNGKFYIAGAHNSQKPACLGQFSIENDKLSETGKVSSLQSFTGIDISIRGDSLFVTSGDKGGIQKISTQDLSLEKYLGYKDVRGIEYRKGLFYVFAGTPAQFVALDEDLEIKSWFPLHAKLTKEDKSRLHVGENVAFLAMNDKGFQAICLKTGEVLSEVSKFPGEDLNTSPNYALDVVAYGRYVITASGYNGLQIYDAGEKWDSPYCNDFEIKKLQEFAFSDGSPASHVELVGDTLFVTAGEKGLKILSLGEGFKK